MPCPAPTTTRSWRSTATTRRAPTWRTPPGRWKLSTPNSMREDSMETQMIEEGSPAAGQPREAVVRRPGSRSRALLVILGGGLLVALVAAGFWLHYRDR